MSPEEQAPESRPSIPEEHGNNVSWQVSGTNVNSEAPDPSEHMVERVRVPDDVDRVDVPVTVEELKTSGIPDGHYVALAPGLDLKLTSNLDFHEAHRQAIFVGRGELVVQDHVHGFRTRHFTLPHARSVTGDFPIVTKIVVANIRQKAIGWKSLGTHLILFFDSGDRVVTQLDSSVEYGNNSKDTWEFHLGALSQLCTAAGIAFESQSYASAQQFVAERPEWAPPKLEFEVDHLPEERLREWGLAIALGLPIAFGLLAVLGGALLWFGPVGQVVQSLEGAGIFVAAVLTIWSHSRWRMKRSLRRRRLGDIPIGQK